MVFNASFNNISVLSWRSVLLVDETGENHPHVTDKLDHINVVHSALIEIRTAVVIGTNFIGSLNSTTGTIQSRPRRTPQQKYKYFIIQNIKYTYLLS